MSQSNKVLHSLFIVNEREFSNFTPFNYRVIPCQLSQAMSPYISDFADFYTVEST